VAAADDPQGTFVINGAERVIVSHCIVRLVWPSRPRSSNGKMLHRSDLFQIAVPGMKRSSTRAICSMSIGSQEAPRKFLTTIFFRALSFLDEKDDKKDVERGTDADISRCSMTSKT